ncbi:MAG: succinylglutamate desuccinylase/aspartoacylase family protein [Acidimicrobiia bacterium]|nr:succinylglutamate desuccinylase/aspartoacylase family protein [Acidimicrobiia bacterium]
MARRTAFSIGGSEVRSGTRSQVELPVSRLITGAQMSMPVTVIHGPTNGPTVWINAAIHGDELNGVEIVNRVLADLEPKKLHGTLLAVPVVNVHGFITGDRYLPDRRDLNRSFPGSAKGSLASRTANLFMTEIVQHCSVGIDLHTASDNRTNLPQIRADLNDPETKELAEVFGASVMMHSKERSGSLRHAGSKAGSNVLLFEAGEALRFNHDAISAGVAGVRRVLRHLEMADWDGPEAGTVRESRSSAWVRASRSGVVRLDVEIGDEVTHRQEMGTIIDAFGKRLSTIRASRGGLVVGRTMYPLSNKGDALVHIASLESASN